MMFNYRKNLLLLTTVLCGASALAANAAKAQDLDILEILNASETKSPNISWALGSEGDANTVEILGKYYTYTWTQNDPNRGKYTTRQDNTLSGDVNADFIGSSYTTSFPFSAIGGAVLDYRAMIDDITGDFVGNYVRGDSAQGGAVCSHTTISSITGDFIGNYAFSTNGQASGGAVYTYGPITSIIGNFVGNYVSSNSSDAQGGAMYDNRGMIGNIIGDFINNYAYSSASYAIGGAVYSEYESTITSISGDFVGNYASGSEGTHGGAIFNFGSTITFVADGSDPKYQDNILFQGNYVTTNGGNTKNYEAIYNSTQTFPWGNYGGTLNFEAQNGGSYTFYDYINGDDTATINFKSEDNSGVLNLYNHIKGQGAVNFVNSYTINTTGDGEIKQVQISNLKIDKDSDAKLALNLDVDLANSDMDSFNLSGDKTSIATDHVNLSGLNLLNDMKNGTDTMTLTYANKDFTTASDITRYISTSKWIYAYTNDATSLIISKYAASGGYVAFLLKEGAFAEVEDERSYHFTEDETIKHDGLVIGDSSNLTINGNGHTLSAETKDGTSTLKLAEGQSASMSNLLISGFETGIESAGTLSLSDVTIKDSTTGLKLGANVELSRTNTFEGNTTDIAFAEGEYTLKLAEDSVLNLNALTTGTDAKLSLTGSDESYINIGDSASVSGLDLILDGPTLKLADESTNLANVNSFEARSGTLDLQNDVVRALVAQDFSVTGAINLLVDADLANKTMDTLGNVTVADGGSIKVTGIKLLSDGAEELTQIDFAGEEYKDKVSSSVKRVLSTKYAYAVKYNEEMGQFEFVRSQMLQPEDVAVNRGSTIANAGAVMLTEAVSQKVLNADSIKAQGASSGDAFGLKAWVQTFGSRDDVELKHLSPTIDAKFYGVLGGIDSKTFAYDNGVKATYGVYGAYTRSEQKYSGNKIKQKGGYFGLKALFEKGGLFSKLTANMGFLNNEALTEWGKDKFDTKVISAATQTGYDFKLKPAKVPFNLRGEKPFYEMNMDVTITPSLYVGYMGIDTDDYTSKAGTAIKNKFMNVVEIAPELKVSNNFGNGLEGYLKGAYKMFIYDNDQVKVDTALLSSMSVKPYVEYGFGFEKTFNSAKAYGDIMRHDGGKEGWDFNLGIKLEF